MQEPKLGQLVEAILFTQSKSLTLPEIAKVLKTDDRSLIKEEINKLNQVYEDTGRTFFIQNVAGGYLLTTRSEYQPWIVASKTVKAVTLSPSVMETLSIVAYKQPVTRADVEEVRSVDASYAVRSLLDKGLIRIQGRKEVPGRPLLYGTSKQFLEVFGFKTLGELPRPEEFDLIESTTQTEQISIEGHIEE
ncbi:MAG: SMC-Scp complex subunit ScpB [SAR324 cluster bacterium]|nr:SMC-Scp complex subunit ScpB [SAR324 cluster bacterium]